MGTLGMYLANLSVLAKVGASLGSIYKTLVKMQRALPAMERLVHYMNLPTDIPLRKSLNRGRREATTIESHEKSKAGGGFDADLGLPLDQLPIKINNINFTYKTCRVRKSIHGLQFRNGSVSKHGFTELKQGQLIAIVGPPGEGKSTLLKI